MLEMLIPARVWEEPHNTLMVPFEVGEVYGMLNLLKGVPTFERLKIKLIILFKRFELGCMMVVRYGLSPITLFGPRSGLRACRLPNTCSSWFFAFGLNVEFMKYTSTSVTSRVIE